MFRKMLEMSGLATKTTPAMKQLARAREELRATDDPRMRAALLRDIEALSAEVAFDAVVAGDAQGAAIEKARTDLRELEKVLCNVPKPEFVPGLAIPLAIEHGALIFDQGSHIGCAVIYDLAARMIVRALEKGRGSSSLPWVTARLEEVGFDPITSLTANKRAWDLRHAFDEIMARLIKEAAEPAPVKPTPAKPDTTKAPIRRVAFVSHASGNKVPAEGLVGLLESQGVPCWISSRDIQFGENFADAITRAIQSTAVTLVLLSAEANNSHFVSNELDCAVRNQKPIIPVRLEPAAATQRLDVFVGSQHCINYWDGAPNREEHLRKLVASLRALTDTTSRA